MGKAFERQQNQPKFLGMKLSKWVNWGKMYKMTELTVDRMSIGNLHVSTLSRILIQPTISE